MQEPQEPMRHELLTWADVDQLMDVIIGQLREVPAFDALLMITRGGIIPGGVICEALDIKWVLTAAVRFPSVIGTKPLAAWPNFLQFPEDNILVDRRVLIIDDVWGSGRTIGAVSGRVDLAGGKPFTCVMHYNPYRSLFTKTKPYFFGAITDARIIYPWEVDRGMDNIRTGPSGMN